ncbi:hypothetical protein BP5796_10188 [Coleophoma crateriformis]|uniref:Uncharacterized protein n=1 Tax=Coleophoma crateriformis TaxID=565419 RepID=A0A3D8QUH3_9HELO|nr:hypothetical protein BP5796_10188 [Coleophoma crateriformis]
MDHLRIGTGTINYARRLTRPERRMRARGFDYVSTNSLEAWQWLEPHGHNSDNTHLVVTGELTLWPRAAHHSCPDSGEILHREDMEGEYKFREVPCCAQTYGPGEYVDIDAMECYTAYAGPDGCTFVEGMKSLSPTSATRFFLRGMIKPAVPGTGELSITANAPLSCPGYEE